jgi:hypothetical protein
LLGIHAMALPALHSSLSHAWAHSIACCRFVIMSIVAPLTFTGIQPSTLLASRNKLNAELNFSCTSECHATHKSTNERSKRPTTFDW